MMRLAPDSDLLTIQHKIEVFDAALSRTIGEGNDLYEVLWIKSSVSEEWLMSIAGYILGVRDRHVSLFLCVLFYFYYF